MPAENYFIYNNYSWLYYKFNNAMATTSIYCRKNLPYAKSLK
jgi:hypothetical protein